MNMVKMRFILFSTIFLFILSSFANTDKCDQEKKSEQEDLTARSISIKQSAGNFNGPSDYEEVTNYRPTENYWPNSSNNFLAPTIDELLDGGLESAYVWRINYIDEQDGNFSVRLIEQTIDERFANIIYTAHTSRLINLDHLTINSGDKLLDKELKRLAAGPRVDDKMCKNELESMLHLLNDMEQIVDNKRQQQLGINSSSQTKQFNESHLRLAQVIDSYAHYDSGLLLGKTNFLGSYSQCLASPMLLKPSKLTKSRYCFAKLSVDKHLNEQLKTRWKPEHESAAAISVAVCLPETCHSFSFDNNKQLLQQLTNSQFKLPKSIFVDEHLELIELHCDFDEDSRLGKLPPSGKLFLFFTALWLVLVIYATSKDEKFVKSIDISTSRASLYRRHFFESFNLKNSYTDFVSKDNHSQSNIQLDVLNPIKVFCTIIVVIGHCLMVMTGYPMDFTYAYNASENDPFLAAILNGTLVVDSFYVISGLLITFIGMRRFASKARADKPMNLVRFFKECFQIIFSRYLRLVPLYAIVFWFHKSIFMNMGRGPYWDQGLNKYTEFGACRQESWLTPFTFLAAYQPLSRQCLPHSWSVAGDIFFIFIIAPIIILMIRRPKLAAYLSISICILSNWLMFKSTSVIQGTFRDGLAELRYHSFSMMFSLSSRLYTAPHYRIFSVLIGVLAGYSLYYYYYSLRKNSSWPNWLRGIGTKLSIGYIITVAIIPSSIVLYKSSFFKIVPLNHLLFDVSMTIGRLLWALANAVLFTRMTTDWKDSFLMQQAAGIFWKSLAKLSFSILLIHLDIIFFDIQSNLVSPAYSRYKIFSLAALSYLASILIGTFLHLIVENPIEKFIKGFMNGLGNVYEAGKNAANSNSNTEGENRH